jgi:ribosomal protein S6--L-glutamate ligase
VADAVIPRIGFSITRPGASIVRQFERLGSIVHNTAGAILLSRDKIAATQVMAECGLPVPKTIRVASMNDCMYALRAIGSYPLVIKASEGTQGSSVFLMDDEARAISLLSQMFDRGMRPLVQEYIEESHGRDVRVIVVRGRVVASMMRKARGSEFRSNFHLGGSVEAVSLTSDQANVAVKAANELGLDVAGVDMLESASGPLLLEANSSPGLEGIERATGVNVAARIVSSLRARVREASEAAEEMRDTLGKNVNNPRWATESD